MYSSQPSYYLYSSPSPLAPSSSPPSSYPPPPPPSSALLQNSSYPPPSSALIQSSSYPPTSYPTHPSSAFLPPSSLPPPSSLSSSFPPSFDCPIHNQPAKRICSYPHCSKRILLCEDCLFGDPGHISEHKEFIVFLAEFWGKQEERERKRNVNENREKTKKNGNLRGNLGAQEKKQGRRIFESKNGKNLEPDMDNEIENFTSSLPSLLSSFRFSLSGVLARIDSDLVSLQASFSSQIQSVRSKIHSEMDEYLTSVQNLCVQLESERGGGLGGRLGGGFGGGFGGGLGGGLGEGLGGGLGGVRGGSLIFSNGGRRSSSGEDVETFLRKFRDGEEKEEEREGKEGKEIYERIRKVFQNPPGYREGESDEKAWNDVLIQIPTFSSSLHSTLRSMISFIFSDLTLQFPTPYFDRKFNFLPKNTKFSLIQQNQIPTKHQKINCLTVLPDGNKIATGGSEGGILIWNLGGGENVGEFQGHKGGVMALGTVNLVEKEGNMSTFNEEFLVSGASDRNIILWNLNNDDDTIVLKGHEDSITCLADLQDGRNIVSCSIDQKIIIWDLFSAKISTILPCNGSVYNVHVMKKGNRIVSCDYSGAINVWKLEYQGKNVLTRVLNEKVIISKSNVCSVVSPFGNPDWVIGGCADGMIRIWDIPTGKEVHPPTMRFPPKLPGEICDLLLLESPSSVKNEEMLNFIVMTKNENGLFYISYDGETKKINMSNLNINNVFTFPKCQVVKCSLGLRVITVNQSEVERSATVWRLEATKGGR